MLSRRLFLFGAAATLRAAGGSGNPVGCQNNAWKTPPEDFEAFLDVLEIIRDLGFDGFEANVRYAGAHADRIEEVRERIAATGLRFLGAHTGMQAGDEELERRIRIAAGAGAERLVLSGKGLAEDGPVNEARLQAKAERLERLGELCQEHGLRLAYHNHQGEFLDGSREMDELLWRTAPQDVSVLLDIGHAYLAGADIPAFMRRHHRRIEGLHVRDIKNGEQVRLGQGEIDHDCLAAAIRETGWPGWLVVEEELRTTDFYYARRVAGSDRKFLRKVYRS